MAFAVASVLADVEASADDGAEDDDVEDDDDADDDAVDEFDESPQPDSDRQRAAAAMGAIRWSSAVATQRFPLSGVVGRSIVGRYQGRLHGSAGSQPMGRQTPAQAPT